MQKTREYFPATDVHLAPRKQIHRKKSLRHRDSEHRHTGKRLQVKQTREAREFAASQHLLEAIQDALLGAEHYSHQLNVDERVERELDPIFNAKSDWEKWKHGERFGMYNTPTEIAAQEAALGVTPTPLEIATIKKELRRKRAFREEAYGRHKKTGARGSVY